MIYKYSHMRRERTLGKTDFSNGLSFVAVWRQLKHKYIASIVVALECL